MLAFYLPAGKDKGIFKLNRIFQIVSDLKKNITIISSQFLCVCVCVNACDCVCAQSVCVCLKSGSIYIRWLGQSEGQRAFCA